MDLHQARAFLRDRHNGVLATIKRDGRPQLSNILYVLDDDGRIRVSVTQSRAKTHNLRRDPRASLHVQGSDWYEFLVVDGVAEFIEGAGVGTALRDYYRKVRGEHPDWAEYDAAMIKDQRLLLSISIDHSYGTLRQAGSR
ncbi:MAG: PPOX class F420-dependent oxidoreductase [Candidatus Dormibacteraeota bacterium]|nr:PPOX class F420-dependent oxidoreductase [Candidatus Dormibacteraeota bacterium]